MIQPDEDKCGDCTVCCEIMGYTGGWKFYDRYNEAEKFGVDYGEWSTCNKLCDTGCSIHQDKPKICEKFFCSYVKYDMPKEFKPNDCGFVAHIQPHNDVVGILSTDKTMPPEILYDNNKQMIEEMIEEIEFSEGKRFEAWFHSKQGSIQLKGKQWNAK